MAEQRRSDEIAGAVLQVAMLRRLNREIPPALVRILRDAGQWPTDDRSRSAAEPRQKGTASTSAPSGAEGTVDVREKTYTFLRMTLVALLLSLGAAVIWQTYRQGWQILDSVSAYYYTPAQPIFVGSLIGLARA